MKISNSSRTKNQVNCLDCPRERTHDFKLFKRTKTRLKENIKCLGDKGDQGIEKIHKQSQTPHKKKRSQDLDEEQKLANKQLASLRIIVEHVYRHLKVFRYTAVPAVMRYSSSN